MDLKCSGIYLIRNTINDKVYVGQSKNVLTRISQHKNLCHSVHLRNAIKKYGWDKFEVSILEYVDNLSQLTEREQYWLNTLDACNPEVGYNICPVAKSSAGTKHSDETIAKMRITRQNVSMESRAKMSAAHMGHSVSIETRIKMSATKKNISDEARANISAAKMGHIPSIETRTKISISLKGRTLSNETKIKISASLKGVPKRKIPISDEQKPQLDTTLI
jgi:group I intron endonuclease